MNNNYTYNHTNTGTAPYAPAEAYPNINVPHHTAPRKAAKVKVPGRAGAIARLIVMFAIVALGLFSIVASIFTSNWTLGQLIVESIASIGLMLLLGAWFWGMMKWVGFIAPKSLGWAKSFWRAWSPLTFFGLYIKVMIFAVVLIAPISAGFASNGLLVSFAFSFAENPLNIFSAFGILLLGVAVVAVLTFLDVCKIKGWSAIATAKTFIASRKH